MATQGARTAEEVANLLKETFVKAENILTGIPRLIKTPPKDTESEYVMDKPDSIRSEYEYMQEQKTKVLPPQELLVKGYHAEYHVESSKVTKSSEYGRTDKRVTFVDEITPEMQGHVVVKFMEPNIFQADIGLLRDKGRYRVSLTIPRYFGKQVSMLKDVPDILKPEFKGDPVNCKHEVTFEILAHATGRGKINKLLTIKGSADAKEYTIKLSYGVIPVGWGTPSLKRDIEHIGYEQDSDSDSDSD